MATGTSVGAGQGGAPSRRDSTDPPGRNRVDFVLIEGRQNGPLRAHRVVAESLSSKRV
jgi:hypothetical protein